ncbi:hypothetical protein QBC35DRAFT_455575 [Podospora australis]|uniref:Uncharacterized protein n=1 Tax=Podospora australis TaxID=1536484 RepID=A0AAN6WM36_9PEZI|nr:hypothetical protein QBC35DRAFT_455575 [Podospora australis]
MLGFGAHSMASTINLTSEGITSQFPSSRSNRRRLPRRMSFDIWQSPMDRQLQQAAEEEEARRSRDAEEQHQAAIAGRRARERAAEETAAAAAFAREQRASYAQLMSSIPAWEIDRTAPLARHNNWWESETATLAAVFEVDGAFSRFLPMMPQEVREYARNDPVLRRLAYNFYVGHTAAQRFLQTLVHGDAVQQNPEQTADILHEYIQNHWYPFDEFEVVTFVPQPSDNDEQHKRRARHFIRRLVTVLVNAGEFDTARQLVQPGSLEQVEIAWGTYLRFPQGVGRSGRSIDEMLGLPLYSVAVEPENVVQEAMAELVQHPQDEE